MKKNIKAIVTLIVGKKYEEMYEKYCRKSWEDYSEKYSYDLILLKDSLDNSQRSRNRSIAWQKLLILSQSWSKDYEQIVWLDSDIIVNSRNAPCVASLVPINKIGGVESYSIPSKEIYKVGQKRSFDRISDEDSNFIKCPTPESFYINRGIPGHGIQEVLQTGMFVCSPKFHRELLENIYFNYEDNNGGEYCYEMPAMSYEVIKNEEVFWLSPLFNFCVNDIIFGYYPFLFEKEHFSIFERISNKFLKLVNSNHNVTKNFVFKRNAIKTIIDNSYFTHFAGATEIMKLLK